MKEEFSIHLFYPDGGLPESGSKVVSDLSPKWLKLFSSFLKDLGPVFKQNMGSTLSHFDINMGGPCIELFCHKKKILNLAISLGKNSKQDEGAVNNFHTLLKGISEITKKPLCSETLTVLNKSLNTPTLLVFDYCVEELSDNDHLALYQLGEHLAGSYFKYCNTY